MISVTASDLPRFLTCNGSVLMGKIPPVNADTELRDQGRAADWVIAQVFTGQFTIEELIDRKSPDGVYITSDMAEHLEAYLAFIQHNGQIEYETNHAAQAYEVRGRTDHIFVENNVLNVSDFKYGWKIVEPEENWTLISHATGYFVKNGYGSITHITFRIFQPRPYHSKGPVREWTIPVGVFYNDYVLKMLHILQNPTNTLQTSQHCYKCPSLAVCPAAQKAGMIGVEVSEVAFNNEMDNDTLEILIEQTRRASTILEQNLKAFSELALHRLMNGQHMRNHMIDNDYGSLTWNENVTPELMKMMTGNTYSKEQLITPKQAIDKGANPDVIGVFATRKYKGVKLVQGNAAKRAEKLLNKPKGTKND